MAVETNCVVHIHENPLDKCVVWQRRVPQHKTSVRLQKRRELSKGFGDSVSPASSTEITEIEPEDKIDSGVNRSDYKSDDYHYSGYAVLAAASKGPKNPGRRAVIDESASRLTLTSPSYQTFHRRHTSGTTTTYANSRHVQESKQSDSLSIHRTRTRRESSDYENDSSLFPGIFCCGRSANSIVDECTCMCCVKGLFYHCTKDLYEGEAGGSVEQPCTCELSRGCVKRWSLLTVCSIFLPCLCCYLPAKGCSDVYKSYKEHKKSCEKRRTRGLDR